MNHTLTWRDWPEIARAAFTLLLCALCLALWATIGSAALPGDGRAQSVDLIRP